MRRRWIWLLLVASVGAALVGCGTETSGSRADPVSASAAVPTQTGPASPYVVPLSKTCQSDLTGYGAYADIEEATAGLPDIEEQRRVVAETLRTRSGKFVVVDAKPSPIGVVAVVSGSAAVARSRLPEVAQMVEDARETALNLYILGITFATEKTRIEVEAELGLEPYGASESLNREYGAVVIVQSKTPIPDKVLSVLGPRDNGVVVVAQTVPYSDEEIEAAQERVRDGADPELRVEYVGGCTTKKGLEVYAMAHVDDDDVDRVTAELADLAGMPVEFDDDFDPDYDG